LASGEDTGDGKLPAIYRCWPAAARFAGSRYVQADVCFTAQAREREKQPDRRNRPEAPVRIG